MIGQRFGRLVVTSSIPFEHVRGDLRLRTGRTVRTATSATATRNPVGANRPTPTGSVYA